MTVREDSEFLRMVIPSVDETGESYSLVCRTEYRDLAGQEYLRVRNFKWCREDRLWIPTQKGIQRDWDDFLTFRSDMLQLMDAGWRISAFSLLDIIFFLKFFHVYEARIAIISKKNFKTEKQLTDFKLSWHAEEVEHRDGNIYTAKLFVSGDYEQEELYDTSSMEAVF